MPRRKRCASPFEIMDDDFDDTSSQSSRNGNPPIQRNAANARERARMRVLSSAFGRLKTKLPNIPADTKLSKLDTLRLATMYIKQLKSVVESGAASPTSNSELMEGAFSNNSSSATNCYLNLNMGSVQSMNWPFGFHHLSNSPLIRSTSSTSLINNNSSSNNWCPHDNNTEDKIKHAVDDTENYEHHHHQHTSVFLTQRNNHHSHNNWYSETPSPEVELTSSTRLTFENSRLQNHPQQQVHTLSHHRYQNLSHVQSESTHSSTYQFKHDFHTHDAQQNQATASHHLHQNGFGNLSTFQSTSIR